MNEHYSKPAGDAGEMEGEAMCHRHESMHKTRPQRPEQPSAKKGGGMESHPGQGLVTSDRCGEMESQFFLRESSP